LERMSFALFRASIRWSSDLSGAALEDWTGACIAGGSISAAAEHGKGIAGYLEKSPV
jgi:hypothetical protein